MNPTPLAREEQPTDFPGEGYLEFRAREAFHELRLLFGFEKAREIIAEIVNDEAQGVRRHEQ